MCRPELDEGYCLNLTKYNLLGIYLYVCSMSLFYKEDHAIQSRYVYRISERIESLNEDTFTLYQKSKEGIIKNIVI